ncbi:MAG: glycosyltransferase family 4 protein [Candidatus Omnitrophica bacterium]|nr:glycosyltransferase family 4 protein [Candidatus Omnitrophota bacterium]
MQSQNFQPIRVLHIITRFIIGGAQENTLLTVLGLGQTGRYELTLMSGPAIGPEGSLIKKAQERTNFILMPELRRNVNLYFDIIALVKLYIFLKKNKFDIVHTHSSKAGILGRIAAKLAGIKIIIHTIHGLPFFKEQHPLANKVYLLLEKFVTTFTSKVICVSQTIIDEAVRLGVGPHEKFIKIFSGVNLSAFHEHPQTRRIFREKLNIHGECPVVGKVARLYHLKGHEFLIEAAVLVKKKIPDVKFVFFGDGILKEELILQAKKLSLENTIIFAGLIIPEAIPYYLQVIDVLAHVSLHEGLPRAVVQGFALGKPAVCFNVDGVSDVVFPNMNGFLIEPKNIKALAESIIVLLEDTARAKKLGEEGKKFIFENLSAGSMVSLIDFVYQEQLLCGQ